MNTLDSINSSSLFSRNKYLVIRSLLPSCLISFAHKYILKQLSLDKLRSGDNQLTNTPRAYGDPIMEMILEDLSPQIEDAIRVSLFPTYAYFRVYKNGDILEKHKDRPACEVSVTINLWSEDSTDWSIYLETHLETINIQLNPGDALIYRGCDVSHWREAFTGVRQIQAFFHYVDRHGKFSEWKFDKRSSLNYQGQNIAKLLLKNAKLN